MHSSLAVVVIHHEKNHINNINYDSIVQSCDGMPVYRISTKDFNDYYYDFLDSRPIRYWSPKEIWLWGSDNIFLYWLLSQIDKVKAKNYLILEWDTHIHDIKLVDFFGEENLFTNTGMMAPNVYKWGQDRWNWFDDQMHNPLIENFYEYNNFTGCSPLCGTLISHDCVMDIVEHIKEHNFANKIYVETKFATIAQYLGYNVKEYGQNVKNHIGYDYGCIQQFLEHKYHNNDDMGGVYHPIKDMEVWQKYFKYRTHNLNKNNQCLGPVEDYVPPKYYYGLANNVKDTIETLAHHKKLDKQLIINTGVFGDPVIGKGKKLYIEYELDGKIYRSELLENTILDLNSVYNIEDNHNADEETDAT